MQQLRMALGRHLARLASHSDHSVNSSMFKTILVPTDGSPLSEKAVEAAVKFAQTGGCRVVALSVCEPHHHAHMSEGSTVIDTDRYDRRMQEVAHGYVNHVAEVAKEHNVPCDTVVKQSSHPYEEIIAAAKEFSCDVIFMASHGRKGLSALFVGSETHKVLAHSTVPVLVFR